jgi:ubiquitin-conjugating enzyme E2 T
MSRSARLGKELALLDQEPPPGIYCYPKGDKINELEAIVEGGAGTPYEGGSFKLDISVPERYVLAIQIFTPAIHLNHPK